MTESAMQSRGNRVKNNEHSVQTLPNTTSARTAAQIRRRLCLYPINSLRQLKSGGLHTKATRTYLVPTQSSFQSFQDCEISPLCLKLPRFINAERLHQPHLLILKKAKSTERWEYLEQGLHLPRGSLLEEAAAL